MNHFNLSIDKNGSKVKCELTMMLSKLVDEKAEPLKAFLEIEILQGEKRVFKNGNVHYRLNLPVDKAEKLMDSFKKLLLDHTKTLLL